MHDFSDNHPFSQKAPVARKGANPLIWLLAGAGILVILCCGAGFAGLVYIGAAGPETFVYLGKDVPASYVETARDVGALEEGENIDYFYSDALVDIKDGFYIVTDRKLVIYIQEETPPLVRIPYNTIVDCQLDRETSPIIDSDITIVTDDGEIYLIPISSEMDRDESVYETILSRSPNAQ